MGIREWHSEVVNSGTRTSRPRTSVDQFIAAVGLLNLFPLFKRRQAVSVDGALEPGAGFGQSIDEGFLPFWRSGGKQFTATAQVINVADGCGLLSGSGVIRTNRITNLGQIPDPFRRDDDGLG